MSHTTI